MTHTAQELELIQTNNKETNRAITRNDHLVATPTCGYIAAEETKVWNTGIGQYKTWTIVGSPTTGNQSTTAPLNLSLGIPLELPEADPMSNSPDYDINENYK